MILNCKNGKGYIGSSTYIAGRIGNHYSKLRNNNHHNQHLQRAWNRYGEDAFVSYNLEEMPPDIAALRKAETKWILKEDTINNGYNFSALTYGSPGCSNPELKGQRISQAKMGHAVSDATKQRIRQAKLGTKASQSSKTQARDSVIRTKNARSPHELNGKRQSLQQWANEYGLKRSTVEARMRVSGWSLERALSTPV